jgi:hypothetical protein
MSSEDDAMDDAEKESDNLAAELSGFARNIYIGIGVLAAILFGIFIVLLLKGA